MKREERDGDREGESQAMSHTQNSSLAICDFVFDSAFDL